MKKQIENTDRNIDIFNSLDDIILIIDDDYNIEFVNQKGKEIFDLNQNKTKKFKCYDLICKIGSPNKKCSVLCHKKNINSKDDFILEEKGIFFKIKTKPIHDRHLNQDKYIEVLQDITEKRKLEQGYSESIEEYQTLNEEYLTLIEELEEKNKKITEESKNLEMLFKNMSSAFALHRIIVDDNNKPIDYEFIDCNGMFEKMTGLKSVDIIGKTVKQIIPNIEDYWIETYGQVALTREPVSFTNYSKGLNKYYEVKAYAPKLNYFAVTFYDISSLLKAKEELKKSNNQLTEKNILLKKAFEDISSKEQLFKAVFNSSPSIIMLLNENTEIIEMNTAGLEYYHLQRDNVKGLHEGDVFRCIETLNNPDGCGYGEYCKNCKIRKTIGHTLNKGKSLHKVEAELRVLNAKDEEECLTLLISSINIINSGVRNILVIIDDISERKNFEIKLKNAKDNAERSEKLKTSFIANMSHEIRTPLNGILGFSQILTSKQGLPEHLRIKYISIINNSSESLLQIVNDILDISSIESGNFEIYEKPFDINDILNDLYEIYTQKIKESKKNIHLELISMNKNIILNTDENRLRQVFINLMDNSIKFTQDGKITFGIKAIEDDKIKFFVSDTGIGISANKTQHIFQRFRQGDDEINRRFGGNGLGLAIVKEIIDLMKGNVWVESIQNKGSVFYFTLPDTKNTEAIEKQAIQIPNKPEKTFNILIVEDDNVNQYFLTEILSEIKAEIKITDMGFLAIDLVKHNKYDIVLMDIRLPDMNGLDAVKEIRKFNRNVHIIAQTAFAMQSDEEEALLSGCNDYIPKPINQYLLIKKILAVT